MIQVKNERCVNLRPATSADLESVLELLRRSNLPLEGVEASSMADFVVAESEGMIVGVAGLELYRQSALLRSVAVEENWRGSGVGHALIDRALSRTQEQGIHDVFLLTTTAREYFPRFGFACIEREAVPEPMQASAEFQGACPDTAVCMRKTLLD